ncbi:MAG TPA: hypothetical protein VJW23_12060 [Propionibacteriaceae bacterium]|nr:hypothetical protein [Propionibacteriaceae bacterium]
MDIKPNFIGTEDSMITDDGVFPLPEAWRELVGLDVQAYWKQQDQERRRQAQLEKCELEFADEEIPDDSRFTLPGYDPDDFTDLD